MLFKGTTLLARKVVVTREFGEETWAALLAEVTRQFPYFQEPVVATSLIPMKEFLGFHDEMLRRLYAGDPKFYWRLGEESGEWALTVGPYKRFMQRKDIHTFVESFPNLWTTYFPGTSSTCEAGVVDGVAWIKAENLPIWHPYFEYLVVGYLKRALQLLGAEQVSVHCVVGGPSAGRRFHYELRLVP